MAATIYYTSPADVRKLYSPVSTANMTDVDIESFIVFAESELNVWLAKRYALPFDSVPAYVKFIATEMTVLKILEKSHTAGSMKGNEHLDVRRKKMDDILDKITSGELELVDENLNIIISQSARSGIESSTSRYEPVMNALPIKWQRQDPDLIDDTLDEVYNR